MTIKAGGQLHLQCPVQPLDRLQSDLNALHGHPYTWRQIGALYGVSSGTAHRIATMGYEPKDPAIRRALGLDQPLHWRDRPVRAVRWALENREAF